MIQNKTAEQLAFIARNGGSLIIDAAFYSKENLAYIARNLTDGAFLQICNSVSMTAENMAYVARNGKVVFS